MGKKAREKMAELHEQSKEAYIHMGEIEPNEDADDCDCAWATYCPIQEQYHCDLCGSVYEEYPHDES